MKELRSIIREEIRRTLSEQYDEPNRKFLENLEELKFDLDQLSQSVETREQERLVERMRELYRSLKDTSDYTYVRRTGDIQRTGSL